MYAVDVLGYLAYRDDRVDSTDTDFAMAGVTEEGMAGRDKKYHQHELYHHGEGSLERAHVIATAMYLPELLVTVLDVCGIFHPVGEDLPSFRGPK